MSGHSAGNGSPLEIFIRPSRAAAISLAGIYVVLLGLLLSIDLQVVYKVTGAGFLTVATLLSAQRLGAACPQVRAISFRQGRWWLGNTGSEVREIAQVDPVWVSPQLLGMRLRLTDGSAYAVWLAADAVDDEAHRRLRKLALRGVTSDKA